MLREIKRELDSQPSHLKQMHSIMKEKASPGSVFCGAGDSLAACTALYYITAGRYSYCEPYTIISDPEEFANKDVYFVSLSGMTASNVRAATLLKGIASKRIAVTSNSGSKLASSCDSIIKIPYQTKNKMPGILSFTSTLSVLLGLASFNLEINYSKLWRESANLIPKVSGRGTTYFLGNGPILPVCIYACLKVYEFTGRKASYWNTEDFMHAPLFSLKESDCINIFSDESDSVAEKFARLYPKSKLRVLRVKGKSKVEKLFFSVFVIHRMCYYFAKTRRTPYFISAKEKLRISSEIIY